MSGGEFDGDFAAFGGETGDGVFLDCLEERLGESVVEGAAEVIDGETEGPADDDGGIATEGFGVEGEFAVVGEEGEGAVEFDFGGFEGGGGEAVEERVFFGNEACGAGDIGADFGIEGL